MPATVPRNLIESAISRLRDLPAREAERVSRKAAIAAMRDEIQVALGKGYSLGEVAKILAQTDENFAGLALSTLRTYLRADRAKAAAATARKNTAKPKATPLRTPPVPIPATPRARLAGVSRTNAGLREDI